MKYVNVYELKRGLKDKQDAYMSAQDKLTPVYQPDYYDVFNKIILLGNPEQFSISYDSSLKYPKSAFFNFT